MPYDADGNWIAYPDPSSDGSKDATGQPYNSDGTVGSGDGGVPTQPHGGSYPPSAPGPAQTTNNGGNNSSDEAAIKAQYQKAFGRDPDANELSTDLANAAKYGLTSSGPTGGVLGGIAARSNNVAGSGVTGNPNGPVGPNVSSSTGKLNTPAFGSSYPTPNVANQPNSSPQFTDPSQQLLESYALNRFQQLQNPDPNSGTALYESYAKQLVDQLKAAPYTQGDEAAIKAGAYNQINQDEATTTQQWMQEMAKRGIPPSSGVALQGIQNIKQQFNQSRASVDQQFATNAIGMSQANRTNALGVLGNLATSENTRLNAAGTYAAIPYNMTQTAFGNNLAAVQAGGNPAMNTQTAIQLATAIQNSQTMTAAQKAQFLQVLYSIIPTL